MRLPPNFPDVDKNDFFSLIAGLRDELNDGGKQSRDTSTSDGGRGDSEGSAQVKAEALEEISSVSVTLDTGGGETRVLADFRAAGIEGEDAPGVAPLNAANGQLAKNSSEGWLRYSTTRLRYATTRLRGQTKLVCLHQNALHRNMKKEEEAKQLLEGGTSGATARQINGGGQPNASHRQWEMREEMREARAKAAASGWAHPRSQLSHAHRQRKKTDHHPSV